ncbi:hypothetical protein KSS87_003549 [Heliosperma pusillum]|nr:hypothetical protein KSS87_003549 [Heliosperma pusillum]
MEEVCVLFGGCSHMTELLEIHSPNPTLHVLFIPGNPGIINFYKDFVESLYELLQGNASVTGMLFDWEHGRLFTLEEQINHKVDFITHELQNSNIPVILCINGRWSVLAHIGNILFTCTSSSKDAVRYECDCYLPRLWSPTARFIFSLFVALMGLVPGWSRFIVKKTIGSSWSDTAIDAGCSHLLKVHLLRPVYHTIRNVLFMAMTEFQKFSEVPDWKFLRENQDQIAFLFGIDDHWGPLSLFEEICKTVPNVSLSIEKEGHDHAFSCTVAGSRWVAQHVATLIQKRSSTL